ncbi:MAG: hypothetical protein K6E76_05550 [Patescibacteria group bacterium]|nr:hypothetical protein [Patescibacteria group bacterium]
MSEISLDNFKNMEIQFFAPKEFKDGDKATITLKNKKDGTEKATKEITLKKLSLIIKDKGQTITDLTKGISKTLDNENTYYKGTLEISFVDANNKPINIIPNLIKEGQNIGFSVQKGLIAFRNDKELKLS